MPTTDKARKLSRLKLRSDQLVEIHLDKIPEPPDQMRRLPGVEAWFQQMRLKEERDQQAFHRMLTQLNGRIASVAEDDEEEPAAPPVINCTTQPGTPGKSAYQIAVDNGFVGTEAQWLASLQGAAGEDGEGDTVLTWMDL
jgi:hypothetical protein